MTTLAHPNKSTTVRSIRKTLVHTLSALAPASAGWAALQLFCWTPRRRVPSPSQLATLARARTVEVRAEGRTIRTYAWGDGPTVLLVHGWGGLAAQLDRFVRPLVASGHRVIAFDLPGHGRSSGKTTDLAEVSRVIRTLAAWFGPLHGVVAHSLGVASTALALADGLEVPKVAFLGSAIEPGAYWRTFLDRLGLSPAAAAAGEAHLGARVGRALREVSVLHSMTEVETNLFVVHDEDDRWADVDGAYALLRRRPAARLMVTQGLGHARILKDPKVVSSVVEFVSDTAHQHASDGCGTPGCTRDVSPDSPWEDPRCFECLLQRELETPALRWARSA
jgi:pimeloyl-ACP methyl ester carboxylesterase